MQLVRILIIASLNYDGAEDVRASQLNHLIFIETKCKQDERQITGTTTTTTTITLQPPRKTTSELFHSMIILLLFIDLLRLKEKKPVGSIQKWLFGS